MSSEIGKGADAVIGTFSWGLEGLNLGELSAENMEFIASWLEDLTLELEENLLLAFSLAELTKSICLIRPAANNSWEDKSLDILLFEYLLKLIHII